MSAYLIEYDLGGNLIRTNRFVWRAVDVWLGHGPLAFRRFSSSPLRLDFPISPLLRLYDRLEPQALVVYTHPGPSLIVSFQLVF